MGDIEHLDFAHRDLVNTMLLAWRKPIEPWFQQAVATYEKPLAELTMPDVLAWVMVFGYAIATGMIAGRIAANVALTVLRGPR